MRNNDLSDIPRRVLGVDYIILKGKGGREFTNGAVIDGDDFMHLGNLSSRQTCYGEVYGQFLVTYADIEITCKECILKIMSK